MRTRTLVALLLAPTLALATTAWAGSPMPVEMKCPVGGKKFTYISTPTMSRWGSRPDGKPYGSWTFPVPLPECPDNGLVMYREFSKPEIKTLKGLIAAPEYRPGLDKDTPYYRAYWLMGKLGDPVDNQLWVLQQASWEADMTPALKQRYQQEFVQAMRAWTKPAPPADDLAWIVLEMRAVNALRELERFDEALQLLDSIPLSSLDVAVPAEKVSGTTPSGYGKYVENYGEIRAAESRRTWLRYAALLRAVITRHDSSSEPLDMVPLSVAVQLCVTYPRSLPEYQAVCESEAAQKQREKDEKMRAILSAPAETTPAH